MNKNFKKVDKNTYNPNKCVDKLTVAYLEICTEGCLILHISHQTFCNALSTVRLAN